MAGTSTKGYRQTPEVLGAVVDGLKAGLTPKRAAMRAGISEGTYFAWRRAGWDEIEATSEDSAAEMSFTVTFALQAEAAIAEYMLPLIKRVSEAALQAEAAIAEYMLPLIKRVSEAALNGGRGDWRAAAMILQGRFPHEFSERVAVAQSQRIEVSGTIGVDGPYKRRALDKMTTAELDENSAMLNDRIRRSTALSGEALDDEISKHERIVAELLEQRDGERHWKTRGRGCFDTSRQLDAVDADFEILKPAVAHEPKRIRAAVSEAPDEVGTGVVVPPVPTTPHVGFEVQEERPTRGFGFNKFGDAINLADEDVKL